MAEQMRIVETQNERPLSLIEMDRPTPSDDQVLIKVAAAGLNRADVLQRKGMYPPPPGYPNVMGLEVSGVIEAVGANVTRWKRGDRVCALLPAGGYAEFAIADEGAVMPVPQGLSLKDAAALPETIMTVWMNVFDIASLSPGESFLIQGGTSGIGVSAIQMAKAHGATVYATAGSDEKCRACEELGADRAINYKTEDFESVISELGGVDVILDMVGGDYLAKHVNILKPQGRLTHIAIQGGMKGEVNILKLMMGRLTVTGSTLRARTDAEKADIASAVVDNIWPQIVSGAYKPIIDSVYPLAEAAQAHQRMESSAHVGKILLVSDETLE